MNKRRPHTLHERLDHLFFLLWRRNEKLNRKIGKLMSILDDIKTINAETKEKVIALDTKLEAALAKNAGYREAIKALKARIEELIAQGGGEISAADAEGLRAAAQEIEDSTDAVTVKADILANTDDDPA